MEGLLIAEQLRRLAPHLPSGRLAWRFPDAHTFVLPLTRGALWLYLKPPNPQLAYTQELPPAVPAKTSFQEMLAARAAGELIAAEQHKLDRVVRLGFGEASGFVTMPPCTLIAELTGRNCNLILTDENGVILGVAREISESVNRYRQLRAGLTYQPPPPYRKLDPRQAGRAELEAALAGRPLKDVRKTVDGIGPELVAALARAAGLPPDRALSEAEAARAVTLLERLVTEPSRMLADAQALPDIETLRQEERRTAQRHKLRRALGKQVQVLQKRLDDIERARQAAAEAGTLRRQAEVLLAYAQTVPAKAREVSLQDFEGQPMTLRLDPRLGAVANAQALFERAKSREARARQASSREAELRAELARQAARLQDLESMTTAELDELAESLAPSRKPADRSLPGVRYTSPQGFEVLVGRNSKENELITFRLARSKDVWLHVQGYPGSHVLVRAGNREVPRETLLFAAQLAAAYSKAGDSENVPVDYTLRKNVWKPKGGRAGMALFSRQKTLYVTPSRRPGTA